MILTPRSPVGQVDYRVGLSTDLVMSLRAQVPSIFLLSHPWCEGCALRLLCHDFKLADSPRHHTQITRMSRERKRPSLNMTFSYKGEIFPESPSMDWGAPMSLSRTITFTRLLWQLNEIVVPHTIFSTPMICDGCSHSVSVSLSPWFHLSHTATKF